MKLSKITFEAVFYGVLLCLTPLASASPAASLRTPSGFYNNAQGSPVVDLIQSARSSIDLEIYEMDDPKVIQAIRDALDRGVVVHIVKEPTPVGKTACRVFAQQSMETLPRDLAASCKDQRQLVQDVNESGGKYVPYSKSAFCSTDPDYCLEHGKILVIDSKIALLSSGNFDTTNLCDLDYPPYTCDRDYSFVTQDSDVVQTLQRVVENDLLGRYYDVDSVMTPGAPRKVTVGPHSMNPLVSFIESAKSRIVIQNQYLKDPTMNAALIAAARRGIEVQVMVASPCSFGKPWPSEAKTLTSIFRSFDDAGIQTRIFDKNMLIDGKPGYLHAKAIVLDDSKAWMGSVNGSTQALTRNREFGIFFDRPSDVRSLSSVMSSDFRNANSESWQDGLNCAEND